MSSSHLAELIAYQQQHASSANSRQGDFISNYFERTDPDEIQARGAATLFAQANAHWRLVDAVRPAQTPVIRIYNPTLAEDGYISEHTVVQIVNDNMPFLVDSVTMAINRRGLTAHWIVHPLMAVQRDDQGGLSAISSVAAAKQSGAIPTIESLIMVECDRIVDENERLALLDDLQRTLVDVRGAVVDWQAMLQRVANVRQACATQVQGGSKRDEALEFLAWLEDRRFTFLGARDYDLVREGDKVSLVAIPDSGLGILRAKVHTPVTYLPPAVVQLMDSDELILVTKAMTRSTVHRPAWLDYVAIKRFNDAGQVIGESRFLGLYTSVAYSEPVSSIPMVRERVAAVMANSGVVPESHAAKSLQAILDDYPRDELFQIDSQLLAEHAMGILRLEERQRTRVFLRRDPFGRFTSAQVFVPRDRYNTELRVKIGNELMQSLNGAAVEFTPMLTDSPMARIHYLVRASAQAPQDLNLNALEARIAKLSQRWEDEFTYVLLRSHGEAKGLTLARRFAQAYPTAYREDFAADMAAEDALVLDSLQDNNQMQVKLYRPLDAPAGMLRFKIYNLSKVALSDSLPLLEHMGARVLDEHPYQINTGEACFWIHDLGLQLGAGIELSQIKARFEALFCMVWNGEVESDDLNRLVLNTKLDARSIVVLRACSRYFKQLGFANSQSYIEAALNKNARITQLIAELFGARFKPDFVGEREAAQAQILEQIDQEMAKVESLDEDRILRQFIATIQATVRTNLWQTQADGSFKPYMSFKINPRNVPNMPEPKPLFEIWVYSPRVEGVHLRFGKVARGGLRWSDRREDFRTEILGLVKAQQVKNTVIVPVGSKGGFVLKKAPPATERDTYQAEGVACYKTFLSGLLDLTDNIVKGQITPPVKLVRHDADDPYLVVAADKGTATFSDIANGISADYGFWLDDAYASGGSVGYDHKKMGITARGAWESVKRHFRAMGINTQTTPFTVAGIGDMSGDVFGNGMLLSPQIKLVAAFDHRHIFIDPSPDPAVSFAERQRMFNLPRSSWDDYDKSLISAGGGVYPRSAKSITLSPEAQAVLGLDKAEIAPVDLLRAILLAPVDLLYNGGIGTYVKASFESNAQVGDKAGDAFRVNGRDLRCKVLAEGGNLGCTQNGRIEFALAGGRIYTDAIDNSAGVDCSDHEVNIKILLGGIVEAGDLTLKQRNDLLASMTDEVASLVLTDNYYQTQAIDIARHRPVYLLEGQQRLIQSLEAQGRLNRALEFLPGDEEITRRKAQKLGLSAPEGAVVLAYAKMAVFDDLIASNLPDDPYFASALQAYFPKVLSERFAEAIAKHPLKREIIATYITNNVVNRAGATFVNFIASEASASAADVIRAFTLAREIFDLEPLWDQIDALDYVVSSQLQLDLLSQLITVAQRASRWILRLRSANKDLPSMIQRYQPAARELRWQLDNWLPEASRAQWQAAAQSLIQAGVETTLAQNLTALEYIFPALDIADIAEASQASLETTAQTYFAVDHDLSLTAWRTQINRLPTDTLWQTQARGSARDDVYSIAKQLTRSLLERQISSADLCQQYQEAVERLHRLLATISTQSPDLAPVSVALRELRNLA